MLFCLALGTGLLIRIRYTSKIGPNFLYGWIRFLFESRNRFLLEGRIRFLLEGRIRFLLEGPVGSGFFSRVGYGSTRFPPFSAP